MGELPTKLQSPEIMIIATLMHLVAVGDDDKVRVFLVVMMGAMDM